MSSNPILTERLVSDGRIDYLSSDVYGNRPGASFGSSETEITMLRWPNDPANKGVTLTASSGPFYLHLALTPDEAHALLTALTLAVSDMQSDLGAAA